MHIIKFILCSLLAGALLLLIPQFSFAKTIFTDEFNGLGNLSDYNNSYERITNFSDGKGEFTLATDHLEATGYDPAYVYTGITGTNTCTSINFNLSNGGAWSGVILKSFPNSWTEELQIRNDSGLKTWILYKSSGETVSGTIDFNQDIEHSLTACSTDKIINGFLDEKQFLSYKDDIVSGGYVGFASQIGTPLDNFRIESYLLNKTLNVPLYKQTDPRWAGYVYDSAKKWSPNDSGIGAWGCSLTSAVMVFKFYGLSKINNVNLNPETLNNWLNTQYDGYLSNGAINWLALSRLSKQLVLQNSITSFDALEFSKQFTNDLEEMKNYIVSEEPPILEEPGHFVVATGFNNDDILINDPYYPRDYLSSYSNKFKSINLFYPSKTDLSYILITTDPDMDIHLKNQGSVMGNEYIQDPINNPKNNKNSGNSIKIILLPKPESKDYTIELNSTVSKNYHIQTYLYDKAGNLIHIKITGKTKGNQKEIIPFELPDTNNFYPRVSTYDSTQNDINIVFNKLSLKNISTKTKLLILLNQARVYSALKNYQNVYASLDEIKKVLEENKVLLKQDSYDLLLYDINYLENH